MSERGEIKSVGKRREPKAKAIAARFAAASVPPRPKQGVTRLNEGFFQVEHMRLCKAAKKRAAKRKAPRDA